MAMATACADSEGTGSGTTNSAASDQPADEPWLGDSGEIEIACSGGPLTFTPSVVESGGLALDPDTEEALDRGVQRLSPEVVDAGPPGERRWMALARGPGEAGEEVQVIFLDGSSGEDDFPPATAASVVLAEDEGEWTLVSSGGCEPEPVLPADRIWVEVALPQEPAAEATTLDVTLSEKTCTGGRDPGPHLQQPVVVETETDVTVYWTSAIEPGAATCPGNPSVERSITLQEPLGERALRDGSVYPPQDLTGG